MRDCISRIERKLGPAEQWTIKIVPRDVCFCAELTVHDARAIVRADGTGFDGAVAAWEAFAEVELLLREHRALRDTAMYAQPEVRESATKM